MDNIMSFLASPQMQGILAMILTIVVLPVIYKIFGYFTKKNQNSDIVQIINTIRDCVVFANQTIVDELKKNGTWTKEREVEVFNLVFDKVSALLSDEAKKLITKLYGSFELWVKTQIEKLVSDVKEEKK